MDLNPALDTFVAECRELLEQMEQSLLALEDQPGDRELLDAVFRAAHTIKGSAGMFGFDQMVSFTHHLENLLDKLRAGELPFSSSLSALLLRSGDHIQSMIAPSVAEEPLSGELQARGTALVAELAAMLGGPVAAPAGKSASGAATSAAPKHGSLADDLAVFLHSDAADESASPITRYWRISLQFGTDVLRNGMDPMSFVRYLATLGDVHSVATGWDRLPPLAEMDPESCYVDLEIELDSSADRTAIEAVFDFVRDDCVVRIAPPTQVVDAQLKAIDALPESTGRLGEVLSAVHAVAAPELSTALAKQASASDERPLGQILVEDSAVPAAVVDAAVERQQQSRQAKAQDSRLIRIDADKLDQLINIVGELVIAGSGTQALAAKAGIPDVVESAASLLRLVEQVRDSALGLRMVAIGATFQRFQRVVRDVSRELGKDIELAISGAETELDKSVVERIGDPLMHLVRNAMDHGIESGMTRVAAGKSARAQVSLNAYHDSGSIVIEVGDDGAGLNVEKIRRKAIERGLLAASANPTPQEIRQLIFEAGFSTADAVSNLSGRGVGMDVVRRSIEALRGTIEIQSEEGTGTTVLIRLPLTLAIIDGFMVGLGAARYVLPLDVVVECMELSEAHRHAVSEQGFINVRGEVLPVLRLRDAFGISEGAARRENVVVVRFGQIKAGLVVDELLGELQTVIKPLGKLFSYLQGISGSTILGSGEVALILDVPGLIKRVEGARPTGIVVA